MDMGDCDMSKGIRIHFISIIYQFHIHTPIISEHMLMHDEMKIFNRASLISTRPFEVPSLSLSHSSSRALFVFAEKSLFSMHEHSLSNERRMENEALAISLGVFILTYSHVFIIFVCAFSESELDAR
jgi:hypothetical protein